MLGPIFPVYAREILALSFVKPVVVPAGVHLTTGTKHNQHTAVVAWRDFFMRDFFLAPLGPLQSGCIRIYTREGVHNENGIG